MIACDPLGRQVVIFLQTGVTSLLKDTLGWPRERGCREEQCKFTYRRICRKAGSWQQAQRYREPCISAKLSGNMAELSRCEEMDRPTSSMNRVPSFFAKDDDSVLQIVYQEYVMGCTSKHCSAQAGFQGTQCKFGLK